MGADSLRTVRFLDALFHAVDGNFSQNMKNKNSDPNDIPLTSGGSAYFAYEKDVATYLRNAPKGPPEVGSHLKYLAYTALTGG